MVHSPSTIRNPLSLKDFMHKALIILLALSLDLIFGDPPNRFHPVVLMGNFLSLGRRRAPRQNRFWLRE